MSTELPIERSAKSAINLIFFAAAVLVVGSFIVVYRVGLIRVHAQEKMAGELVVVQQLDDFLSALKDTETGQRGYLLTGDEPYLEPYTIGRQRVQSKLEGLQRLVISGELPKEKVEGVAVLTGQKLGELEQTIQLRREKGLDAALGIVRGNKGKQVMDEIRLEMAQMRADEEREFATSGRRADWAASARTETFAAACLLNLMFLGWAFRKISREAAGREAAILETRREKELVATTLASIGDAVIVTDSEGRITLLNEEAERLTGWMNSDAGGRPLPEVFQIVNEVTRQPAGNPVEKVLRLGGVAGLANHTVLLGRDGTERPIDDSAAPIRQWGGPVLGVVLVFRDVSMQRKAQEASERLAAIVRHSGDAIVAKNLDGLIQSWNGSAERIFGYTPEEIIGKPVATIIPPERLEEEEQILGRIRQGRLFERVETIRVAKDGRRVPVSLSVSPLRNGDGEVVGASKIIHDITDVVAAREALAAEKELLATTLASIGDAVIVTDAQGRVTFLNAEAAQVTGWSNPEATGRALPEVFRIINEESRELAENPVEKVLRLGKVVGLANHTILLAKNGGEIPIDDSAAPIRKADGEVQGVVLVFRDFSEHKRAEEALRDAHAQLGDRAVQLEGLVSERTTKLREMVNELQHVSYAIVHDLRAPLRAMNAFADAVLEEVSGTAAESPRLVDYCRRIMVASARMDRLIQDSLSYTKAVLQEVALGPVDLARLVRGIIETYPNLQPDRAEVTIEGELPVVLGEESLLTQCFSNLLGNAAKFVAAGTRPQVRVRAQKGEGLARIFVEDNGIGISRQAQTRLFGMFQRLTAEYEGTGMGLAIVRKVVERMGGKVGAESEPGSGSRFWVELPTAEAAQEDAKEAAQ